MCLYFIQTCVPVAGGGGEGSPGRDEEEQEAQKDGNGGISPVTFPGRTSGRQKLLKAACNGANSDKKKHALLKQGRPAWHKARLSGEPQQGHQDEEDTSHHLRIAGTFERHRKVVKACQWTSSPSKKKKSQ